MNVFKQSKEKYQKPKDVEKFTFPENLQMKEIGNSIEGIYQGCLVKPGEGLNGGDLILAAFLQEDKTIKTCVAGSQLMSFLESFEQGYYLKVTRSDTKILSGDRKFAIYSFEYDPDGVKEVSNITFVDAGEARPKELKA